MKVLFVLVAALALSGCAAKVTTSGPRSVVIAAAWNRVDEAQQLAESECSRYGRHAQRVNTPRVGENQHLFDCVQ